MKGLPAINAISALLSLVSVSLGLTVAYQIFGAGDSVPAEAAAPEVAEPSVEPLPSFDRFTFPDSDAFAAVTERPLFSETRRPAEPPPPPPPPEAPPKREPPPPPPPQVKLGQFKLAGIVDFAGGRYALVRHADEDEIIRVREGQTVHEWQVEEIDFDSIVLVQRHARDIVFLRDNEAPQQPNARQRALQRAAARAEQASDEDEAIDPGKHVRRLRAGGGARHQVSNTRVLGAPAGVDRRTVRDLSDRGGPGDGSGGAPRRPPPGR